MMRRIIPAAVAIGAIVGVFAVFKAGGYRLKQSRQAKHSISWTKH